MAEEVYEKPPRKKKSVQSQLVARMVRQRLKPRVTSQEAAKRARLKRLKAAQSHAAADLPNGLSPKLAASLGAAKRRHDEDPVIQGKLHRAQLAKRVQMAKEEAGMGGAAPVKFMGMDAAELEREVVATLPPPMSLTRKKAKAPK